MRDLFHLLPLNQLHPETHASLLWPPLNPLYLSRIVLARACLPHRSIANGGNKATVFEVALAIFGMTLPSKACPVLLGTT
jgi:hypothetical protein